MISRLFYWAVFVAFVVAATWVIVWSVDSADGAEPPPTVTVTVKETVETNARIGGRDVTRWRQLALAKDKTARRQAQTIRRLRRALRRDVSVVEAINVAAVTYGVSGSLLFRKAACESHLNPRARNRSSNASGLFQFLPSTWRSTPYGRLSVWSPVANALAAGWMHRVGRGGEWLCR